MFEYIDYQWLRASQERLKDSYRSAKPFEHAEFRGLIKPEKLDELLNAFPDESWKHWFMYPSEHGTRTKVCQSTEVMPRELTQLIFELNSGPVLSLLEDITGIENLLPDPHLNGAGIHMTLPGGTLTPHTDHHLLPKHPKYRQLNLILYLTKDWTRENQGYFELWDKGCSKVHKEIAPTHGNGFIFRTSDSSVHGFSQPVKELNRRSVILFYYTATESDVHFGGGNATHWHPKTIPAKDLKALIRLRSQQAMWAMARLSAKVAWQFRRAADRLTSNPD